jgi:hypothetical protein
MVVVANHVFLGRQEWNGPNKCDPHFVTAVELSNGTFFEVGVRRNEIMSKEDVENAIKRTNFYFNPPSEDNKESQ